MSKKLITFFSKKILKKNLTNNINVPLTFPILQYFIQFYLRILQTSFWLLSIAKLLFNLKFLVFFLVPKNLRNFFMPTRQRKFSNRLLWKILERSKTFFGNIPCFFWLPQYKVISLRILGIDIRTDMGTLHVQHQTLNI